MSKRRLPLPLLLVSLIVLVGCGIAGPGQETHVGPALVPERHLDGGFEAYGLYADRFGTTRRFHGRLEGHQDGDALVLVEDFRFHDGAPDQRVWRLREVSPGRYEGSAPGLGETATARVEGNALHLSYEMDLPVGGTPWRVQVDDRFVLEPQGLVIKRSSVTKFGLEVGEMIAFFEPMAETRNLAELAAR